MSIYHRFVSTSQPVVTLNELLECLKTVDPGYELEGEVLTFNGREHALIDVTRRGNTVFDEDVELLLRYAKKHQLRNQIVPILQKSQWMLTVQVGFLAGEPDLEPLWRWVRTNGSGVLAWEGDAFELVPASGASGLICS